MSCGHEINWKGCYSGTFDLLTPESFAHPAKMSPALCYRIFSHLEELGLLRKGMTVLDPMAGTGTTLLVAGAKGYNAIGVELESKFVLYSMQNLEYLITRRFCICEQSSGSRQLRQLRERISSMVNSRDQEAQRDKQPPILQSTVSKGIQVSEGIPPVRHVPEASRVNPGQDIPPQTWEQQSLLQSEMPMGALERGTESPLHQGVASGLGIQGCADPQISKGDIRASSSHGTDIEAATTQGGACASHQRGEVRQPPRESNGQRSGDSLTNAPENGSGNPSIALPEVCKTCGKPIAPIFTVIQGDSRKLTELLRERGVITVTSPPYAEAQSGGGIVNTGYVPQSDSGKKRWPDGVTPDMISERSYMPDSHGTSAGQIGQESQESYLSAMRQVYAEIARVSDVCVVVTKNPTRNGKLRTLDLDTIALLESVGYRILCHHKALLFEEQETQDLFGETHKKVKGRMSFFKRLSWQKGSPVAQWEDVIFAVKNGGGTLVTTFSPPYRDSLDSGTRHQHKDSRLQALGGYGVNSYTPGQIGNLK